MTDEKKYNGWKKTYIGLLNAATVICIIIGLFINIGGWIGRDMFGFAFGKKPIFRSSSSASESMASQKVSTDAFDEIDAKIDMGSVNIVYGEGYGYSAEDYPTGEEPAFEIKSGKLKITQKTRSNWNFGDLKDRFKGAGITITIPKENAVSADLKLSMGSLSAEGITFKDLDLEASAGSIELEDCEIKNIELVANMGAVTIKDCTIDECSCTANMGGIELSGVTFDEAKLKADMGGITVDGNFNELKANCSMGGIEVVNSNGDAKMDLSADMGGITVNGESVGRTYKR